MRSPKAAGRAKAADRSGATTPGIKNAKPIKRKLCKMRSGRSASAAQVWPEVSGSDDSPRKETQRDTDSEQGLRRHLRLPSRLKVLRAAFHGIVPDLVAVLVEDELGVLRRREPEPVGELALELARRPAGVAECDQALARAAM